MATITRHTFARLDTDTDVAALPGSSTFQKAVNLWLERGNVTGARGNTLVGYALPEGRNVVVGTCENHTGGVLYFVWNSAGTHQLVRFDAATAACSLVLEHSALNLAESSPVLGATVLDGLLVYLDADKALRSIPLNPQALQQAVAALPADPYALHLVHQPPQVAPVPTRETNDDPNDPRALTNLVADKAWQFAFLYEYPSGERTPIGPYSPVLLRYDAGQNYILIPYPGGALAASPLVKAVRLLARAQDELTWQVVGDMIPGQPYEFYGALTGEAIAALDAAKLHEAVPVQAACMTVAKSRVFVGDCVEGYDLSLPADALLTTVVSAGQGVDAPVPMWRVSWEYRGTTLGPDGQPQGDMEYSTRFFTLTDGSYPDPTSTYNEVFLSLGKYYPVQGGVYTYDEAFVQPPTLPGPTTGQTITPFTGTLAGTPTPTLEEYTLHENTSYPVGLAYFDALGRTAGAEAVRGVLVPRQDYASLSAKSVQWTLSPGAQVPTWARSYALLLGQNATASYFLQFQRAELRTYNGDNPDGSAILGNLTAPLSESTQQLWVSLSPLLGSGRGYSYEPGDRLRFPQLPGKSDFAILGARGGYVAISKEARSLFVDEGGTLLNPSRNDTALTEIYRPTPAGSGQVLYERGPRYAILNPGTPAAAHSITSGLLQGDAVLLGNAGDTAFSLEGMNPDKVDYELWLDASRGRAVPVLSEGKQTRRSALLRYSGVKVQGTRLMGLSVWDATAQDDLPQEQGAVVRLGVADQTQADGSLLLCVQARGAESRYLGQTALQQADGQTTLALTKGVLGGGNALRGGYGLALQDAAAFQVQAGRAYWYCREQTEWVRYAQNGLTPLARTHLFQNCLRELAATYAAETPLMGYDPRRDEVWLTFPATATQRPAAERLSIGQAQPEDVAQDIPGCSLVWNERLDTSVDTYAAAPECFSRTGSAFLSFQTGQCWLHHNAAPYGSFFDRYTAPSLTFTSAENSNMAKKWCNIAIESEAKWLPTRLHIDRGGATPLHSHMKEPWLTYLAGIYRGAFRRAENTKGGILNGNPLHGRQLVLDLTVPTGHEGVPLIACSIGWQPLSGQL